MFYYLSGELAHRDMNTCVIDCGGVGYKLTVSMITSENLVSKLGKQIKLYTHLSVREDGVELFGFGTNEEKECFNRLTSVSGIGPKAAMSILSTMTPEKLAVAICTDDKKAIAKAPGIGAKSAARIILELKDKMSAEMMDNSISTSDFSNSAAVFFSNYAISEASEALAVLGYDKNTVMSALKGIDPSISDVGEIIRQALKKLAR
ncbi:MAG: Holliday junction branch migration protein RuvA [Clostridia bacterium]|nr:Holliday junction branch migration protein RuvA [Clostridia bacterium]